MKRAAGLAVFTVVYFAIAVYWASRRLLWYDELFVYWISALPDPMSIWRALAAGGDDHPPLYYLLAHFAGRSELLLRLPAILAFWGTSLCVYAFVRKSASAACAWLSVALLFTTEAALWAVQARPYAVVLFFGAAALVAWQRQKPVLTELLLTAAIYSGWYAVLLPLPLMAGQWARNRRDRAAWISLILPWLAALPLAPLAAKAGILSTGFWAAPKLSRLPVVYVELFGYAAAGWALAAVLTLFRSAPETPASSWSKGEKIATLGHLTLPVAVFMLAIVRTNAFHSRAAMIAVPGACAGVALLLERFARTLAAPLALVAAFHFVAMPLEFAHQNTKTILRAYETARSSGGPVLLDAALYLPVLRYAGGDVAGLMLGDASGATILERLAPYAPLRISKGEPAFTLVAWLPHNPRALAAAGYQVRFRDQVGEFTIYDCTRTSK